MTNTTEHLHEAETMAEHWYRMYVKVDEENKRLKEQVLKLSRIDLIGLNGNTGEHYDASK
jgi:hypothetical protein